MVNGEKSWDMGDLFQLEFRGGANLKYSVQSKIWYSIETLFCKTLPRRDEDRSPKVKVEEKKLQDIFRKQNTLC